MFRALCSSLERSEVLSPLSTERDIVIGQNLDHVATRIDLGAAGRGLTWLQSREQATRCGKQIWSAVECSRMHRKKSVHSLGLVLSSSSSSFTLCALPLFVTAHSALSGHERHDRICVTQRSLIGAESVEF